MVDNHIDAVPSMVEIHKRAAPLVINMHNFVLARDGGQPHKVWCRTRGAIKSPCETVRDTFADRDKRLVSFCTNAGVPAMQTGARVYHIQEMQERHTTQSLRVLRF